MLSKWGTIELNQVLSTYLIHEVGGGSFKDAMKMIKGEIPMPSLKGNYGLYNNAGVFPLSPEIADRFGVQALKDCQQIDILGSYIKMNSFCSR